MPIINFNEYVYLNSRICPLVGLFLNFLLAWLIWRKTPKEIILYSRILYQTCIFDIFYLLQETIGWPVVIFFDGIFTVFYDGYFTALYKQLFGPVGLYLLYKIHQSFVAMDIFSVVFQFVHRYFLLNRNIRIPLCRYLQMLLGMFLFNLTVNTIYFIHNKSHVIDGIRSEDKEFIGQFIEDLDERKEFAFTVDDKTPIYNKIWHFMVITTFIVCFSVIVILGYRIIHFVRQTSFSEYTRRLNKQLTFTLIILASFPLLSIAILVLFIVITLSLFGKQMAKDPTFLQLQMATSFLQHYIPLMNPIATIVINSPYRHAVAEMLRWKPKQVQPENDSAMGKLEKNGDPPSSNPASNTTIGTKI